MSATFLYCNDEGNSNSNILLLQTLQICNYGVYEALTGATSANLLPIRRYYFGGVFVPGIHQHSMATGSASGVSECRRVREGRKRGGEEREDCKEESTEEGIKNVEAKRRRRIGEEGR